ncbi:hypothetical protein ACFL0P_00695 [Candidatus Omnitrophota bacterium]
MRKCPYCGTNNELSRLKCINEDCLANLPPINEEDKKQEQDFQMLTGKESIDLTKEVMKDVEELLGKYRKTKKIPTSPLNINMDSLSIDKYVQSFAFIISEDISSIPSFFRNSPFKVLDMDKLFILAKEFLLYDLHVCDRCIFGFFGTEIRSALMKRTVAEVALRVDRSREKMLDGMLDTLSIDKFVSYSKILQNTPGRGGFIDDYNRVQIEYSKYKFTREFDKSFEEHLEWEFGKKIAYLAGYKDQVSYILSVMFRTLAFFKLAMVTKEVLDESMRRRP